MSNLCLLVCLVLTLLVSSASANPGVDLALGACAGDAGALSDATVDCGSGQTLRIMLTWAPAEDLPDLSNLDGFIDTFVGTSFITDGFWNFDASVGCNRNSLSSTHVYPPSGCGTPIDYLDTWSSAGSPANSGSAISAAATSTQTCRYAFTCYRPTPLAVLAGEHLFGVVIQIATSNPTVTCPG